MADSSSLGKKGEKLGISWIHLANSRIQNSLSEIQGLPESPETIPKK